MRDYVSRCSQTKTNVFKRSADALPLDVGINDVEFYRWVLDLVLDGATLQSSQGYAPCVDSALKPCDANTESKFDRLSQRFHCCGR